jgi:hypothetical protein
MCAKGIDSIHLILYGSRKDKLTLLGVEAPVRQGAKAQAYRDMSSFRNSAGLDASAHKHVKLFLRAP